MKSSQLKWALVALPLCLALSASPALGQVFSADFGTPPTCDLLQSPDWFGQLGLAAHNGFTFIDTVAARGCVLRFTARVSGGDLFSKTFPIQQGLSYKLKFWYKGDSIGATPSGGVIGISEDFQNPGALRWLESSVANSSIEAANLVDDVEWQQYTVPFDPFGPSTANCCRWGDGTTRSAIRVMLEDFVDPGQNAFFDDIEVWAEREVQIDIKPGSDPNSINLGARGKIPVAILSSADFDAPALVDPRSLLLAGVEVNMIGKKNPDFQCSSEDVNGDGVDDLVCHFENLLELSTGDTEATLLGMTFNGVSIFGTDSVRIVRDP
jgi:hypothetical protein